MNLAIVQLAQVKELACLRDGYHSLTSILWTTPFWSWTEELSHDANTSSGLSPMQVPPYLDHYHNTPHTRRQCHVSFEIVSIRHHRFFVLLNWDWLGTTIRDAMNGKNHYRFHYFFYSLDNWELSDKKGSEGSTREDPSARSKPVVVCLIKNSFVLVLFC